MNITSKPILTNTIVLKVMALIIGFLFWSIVSDSFTASRWVTVPVCFYNTKKYKIQAPETMRLELKGRKSHLRTIDIGRLAVHIDLQTLHKGPQSIVVTPHHLLLADTIHIGLTIPHTLMFTLLEESIS